MQPRNRPVIVAATCLMTAVTSIAGAPQALAQSQASHSVAAVRAVPTVPPPRIIMKRIPFGPVRVAQMAAYSRRHYGINSARLRNPRVIVLHYTVSNNYQSAWSYFAGNQPAGGPAGSKPESPGGCTHFIVDKNGAIYQLAPLHVMCRATIGLNHTSVGIEFVEMSSAAHILQRRRQLQAGRALVRWLQGQFQIHARDVVGHGTANQSPYFMDLRGWKNDHTDWNQQQVSAFARGIFR